MRITNVIADLVKCPLPAPFYPTWGSGLQFDSVKMTIVQIETDEGITGIGAGPATGWENVVGINTFLKQQLLNKDPFMIERLRPAISNAKLRMGWPWMVEAALWDLVGKACGQPVHRLWGGFANEIPVYASTGELCSLEKRIQYVQNCVDQGIQAVKLRMHDPHPENDLETIREIRRIFGSRIKLMVDANQADHLPGASDIHSSWDLPVALKVARALEKLDVVWLEEPLARHNYDGLAALARKVDIPIAGGEKNSGLEEFRTLAERDGYHIIQGDCVFSEGIFQLRKAAALAEAHHKQFIPHTWSNPIGLMTNLQLAASLPNCPWFELPYEPPAWNLDIYTIIFEEGLELKEGRIVVPDRPGLGFKLKEGFLEQNRVPHDPQQWMVR
ncbi:mandelate racemase/muconate lactonizing enzyme family protein [Paenibacillus nasutitermitis]|uniref:Mandelate racemase/muconate lactonizing enzyme C-terminal domain-containing protein n=1 Tax=Paenibacillus nasutitermitis TaxID=1652958 RepID=A0A917DXD2_9BACL|nr:mandelate racemase/muconate lactonizing enzyme family protein [Paenibacillus nasutitermitis]GGD77863.1 hypothetical protein GCM10010911_39800 [Paenibacillus nasutitermitis]